jgi:hypothetical protein
MELVLQLSIALRQMKENSTQEHPTPRTRTDTHTHTYTQAGNLSCSQAPTLTTVWAQCRSPPNPNHHQTNEKPFRSELFKVPARMQQYSRSSVDDTRRARPGKSLPYMFSPSRCPLGMKVNSKTTSTAPSPGAPSKTTRKTSTSKQMRGPPSLLQAWMGQSANVKAGRHDKKEEEIATMLPHGSYF